MRIAVSADVGQPVYHVGDEAIGRAVAARLVRRGHRVTLLTRNIVATLREFASPRVDAAWTLPFPMDVGRRRVCYQHACRVVDAVAAARGRSGGGAAGAATSSGIDVDSCAAGAECDRQIAALVREIARCDAVLIAGGGQFNSLYGWLFLERLLLMKIAAALGKPCAVTGQTLGPELTEDDRLLAGDALRGARLIGWRDAASVAAARAAFPGLACHRTLDDAQWFGLPGRPTGDGCVVVSLGEDCTELGEFDPAGDEDAALAAWARLADRAHRLTGLPLLFVPHMARRRSNRRDEAIHRRVAALVTAPHTCLDVEDAAVSARRIDDAALVLTSRFHPAVFALARGIPVLPVAPTPYAKRRLSGLLENWGMPGALTTVPAVVSGAASAALSDLWGRRDEVAAHLRAVAPPLREWDESYWDGVCAALAGGDPDVPEFPRLEAAASSYYPGDPAHWDVAGAVRGLDEGRDGYLQDACRRPAPADPFGEVLTAGPFAAARRRFRHEREPWMPTRPAWAFAGSAKAGAAGVSYLGAGQATSSARRNERAAAAKSRSQKSTPPRKEPR